MNDNTPEGHPEPPAPPYSCIDFMQDVLSYASDRKPSAARVVLIVGGKTPGGETWASFIGTHSREDMEALLTSALARIGRAKAQPPRAPKPLPNPSRSN